MKTLKHLPLFFVIAAVPAAAQSPAVPPAQPQLEAPAAQPQGPAPAAGTAQARPGPNLPPSGPVSAIQMVEAGATANSSLTPEERAFAKQEEDLLRQIRLAQMQVELMDLQKKISDSMSGKTTEQPQRPSDSVIDAPPRDPFTLVSIWGDESGLKADFLVRGRRSTLSNGGSLPDGWRVARITQSSVDMRRGDETRTLNLGGSR